MKKIISLIAVITMLIPHQWLQASKKRPSTLEEIHTATKIYEKQRKLSKQQEKEANIALATNIADLGAELAQAVKNLNISTGKVEINDRNNDFIPDLTVIIDKVREAISQYSLKVIPSRHKKAISYKKRDYVSMNPTKYDHLNMTIHVEKIKELAQFMQDAGQKWLKELNKQK